MEGTGEMLRLVKPLSMLPFVITRNALAVTCGLSVIAAAAFAMGR